MEQNEVIAEFMGLRKVTWISSMDDKDISIWVDDKTEITEYNHDNLQYHSSWNWLMSAVKKISDTIPILPNWDKVVEYLADVDIDKCFEQVVLAIKWYNKQKTN